MQYLGDFAEDATVYIPFNTFTSDDPQASATITNLVDADIKVHKDGSVTQIVTDGATVAIDFDSITGNHLITIDTSAHADYAIGSDYLVRIEGTTVDAGTINAIVGSFSIENRFNEVNVTQVGGTAQTAGDLQALITTVDTVVDAIKAVTDLLPDSGALSSLATAANLATVDTNVDSILVDTGTTLQAELDAIQAAVITNAAGVDIAADIIAVKAETASILTDTGTTLDGKLDDIQGATFSTSTDSLEAIRDRGDAAWTTGAGGTPPQLLQSTTIATLSTQTSFTLTAGSADDDAYNGAVAIITDASTSTQKAVGSISDYVGSTKTVTLSADPGIFTMATTDTIDILAAISSAPTAASVADAVWDEATSDHNSAGSFGKALRQVKEGLVSVESTVNDVSATTTSFVTALTEASDSHYSDLVLAFIDGNLVGQSRVITSYTGSTKTITFDEALSEAPANGDAFIILTMHAHSVTQIQSGLATASALSTAQADLDIITGADGVNLLSATQASIDAIETDTGTTLQGELDAIQAAVITNAAGTDIAADIIAVKAETASILTDTGTTIPASISGLNDISTADVATELATYDGPTNAEMEARTPTAAELAYITSNAADGLPFTVTSGTTTTVVLANVDGSAASSVDDFYNGRLLYFNAGTLAGQVTDITDYVGSTKTATITAVTTAVTSSHAGNMK